MSDFYNNNNNGDKPPSQKERIIVTAIVVAAIALVFLGARVSSMPMIMGGFFAAAITVFVAAALQGKKKGAKSGVSGAAVNSSQLGKYFPLLADERTKQHPEVQVLLQYTEVQRAFFDPSSLSNPTTANDEHVQELFLVFDEMLAQGAVNGNIYGNPQNIPQPGTMPSDSLRKKPEDEEKKKPIRKAGKIMRFVGIGIFILPFGLVFIMESLNPGSTVATAAVPFVVTGACPMGMLLIIVGIILSR